MIAIPSVAILSEVDNDDDDDNDDCLYQHLLS